MTPIKLRGHHLLCILGYQGAGYSESFVENFDQIIARLNNGVKIQIVEGTDDICTPMIAAYENGMWQETMGEYHCDLDRVKTRDQNALNDINKNLQNRKSVTMPLPLKIGSEFILTRPDLDNLRTEFQKFTIRNGCVGCEWVDLCTNIANTNYAQTRLHCRA